ncbi:SurA N-terminal domain-containing protein [Thermodesulfobacteriota bacterium]
MLRLMRDHATSWMIKFLLGAIVIVFVFWGVGSYRSQRMNVLAQVNGDKITVEEYREAYNNILEQLRRNYGDNLNNELIEQMQVRQKALDGLINQKLVLQEAKKLNFRVTDQELARIISEMPAFQSSGGFDSRLYERILNRYRLTPEEFEIKQRESMLVERLRSFINAGIKISDPEILEWYKWKNSSVNIEFLLFDPSRYTDINITPDEIRTYFNEQRDNYKTDPQVKVRYLHFKPENYKSDISITDEAITEYYQANPFEFEKEKTVVARHILIKVDQGASSEKDEDARKKALKIFKLAEEEGKDFAELAKQFSEGPTKADGGYLGAFAKDKMVKPFSDKAFSMKPGEISEPVRTRFGWHIIKVENVNEASVETLQEAESKIRDTLLDEKAKNLALDEAETAYDATFENDNIETTAEALQLNLQTTDFFTIKGPEKGIQNRTKFASTAFDLEVMDISEIQDFEDGYYIMQVTEKLPAGISEFEAVQEKAKKDLMQEKQNEKAEKDAQACLAALKNGVPMDEESKKYGIKPEKTGFFKRNASIPKIGYDQEINKEAFKLTAQNDLATDVVKGRKGFYNIKLKERKEPDPEGFEKEKDTLKGSLLQQKQYKTYDTWLSELRDRGEVIIEEDFFN